MGSGTRRRVGVLTAGVFLLLGMAEVPAHDRAESEALRSALEATRNEIFKLQQALQEALVQLDRLQRLRGIEHYRFPRSLDLCGQAIPLGNRDLWERMDREFLLMVNDVPQVLLWMKRANRYFPFVEEQLRARGMPEDLKYVAIAESSLRPEAKSHAGAVGLWQFIPATGSRFRLRINQWVDERQDPEKSTEAALAYLERLHQTFGDWFLAMASYNAGEDRIQREMARQSVGSFFDLILPSETERYVFRIAAAKVILSDPKTYGFNLEPGELYEPFKAERLELTVMRDLDLISLAQGIGTTYRALRTLNPQIRDAVLPKGEHYVYVPVGKSGDASGFVRTWNGSAGRGEGKETPSKPAAKDDGGREQRSGKVLHSVQSGETLSGIAQKYKVAVKSIQEWNNLGSSTQIRPGQRLTIHQ